MKTQGDKSQPARRISECLVTVRAAPSLVCLHCFGRLSFRSDLAILPLIREATQNGDFEKPQKERSANDNTQTIVTGGGQRRG